MHVLISCLHGRSSIIARLLREGQVGTWEEDRNKRGYRIHWTFTVAAARLKLSIYHVMSRGNARQVVFRDELDYQRMVDGLEQTVDRFGWQLLSGATAAAPRQGSRMPPSGEP